MPATFWDDIGKYMNILWSVIAMLCMVDGNEPSMGVIYKALIILEEIKDILKEDNEGHAVYKVQVLAQKRSEILHARAFVLNPR